MTQGAGKATGAWQAMEQQEANFIHNAMRQNYKDRRRVLQQVRRKAKTEARAGLTTRQKMVAWTVLNKQT